MRADELSAIEEELATFRIGEASSLPSVIETMRHAMGCESLVLFSPTEGLAGLEMSRFAAAGLPEPAQFERLMGAFWSASPLRYGWYNPIRPEPGQRNRVVEARDLMPSDEFVQAPVTQRVLRPLGVAECWQPRMLLCDRSSLLGWFGCLQSARVSPQQIRDLTRLARPLRRRLALERRLMVNVRAAALHAGLDALGAPAFLITATGKILDASSAGRVLASRPGGVAELLRAERSDELRVERIELREHGCPPATLAIVRSGSRRSHIVDRLDAARRRWSLTARQAQVLAGLVAGEATATIAAELAVSTRTIEMHVTALLRRAGADSRAALVAFTLR